MCCVPATVGRPNTRGIDVLRTRYRRPSQHQRDWCPAYPLPSAVPTPEGLMCCLPLPSAVPTPEGLMCCVPATVGRPNTRGIDVLRTGYRRPSQHQRDWCAAYRLPSTVTTPEGLVCCVPATVGRRNTRGIGVLRTRYRRPSQHQRD